MDSDDNRLKKLHSSKTQRDKELERIKSLAVVSVLNKNFKETTPPPRPSSLLPTLSPSSSLTTDNPSITAATPDGKSRSQSMSRSQTISYSSGSNPLKKPSNTSLHHEYNNNSSSSMLRTSSASTNRLSRILTSSDALDKDQQHHVSEQELDDGNLVTDSPIDTEKETLEKRVQELEALYAASLNDIQALTLQSHQQNEILLLQDKLIQHMSNQLDTPAVVDMQCQLCASDDVASLLKAQQDVAILTRELNELKPLSSEYGSAISGLIEKTSASEHKMDKLEQLAREIQKANTMQTEFIDTKVQTLLDKILRKNEIINKLEHDQQQHLLKQVQYQQLPPIPVAAVAAAAAKTDGIPASNDSITNVIPEEDEDGTDELEPNSARSSYVSHESHHGRKSYISRWKGNAIPPASPPPSLPLPPIPSASSRSTTSNTARPKSTLSEISRGSSIHAQHTSGNKHLSMDAVGGISAQAAATTLDSRRPSVQSQFDEELADAAYYKEFTDQLQERLSMSKEIDDLRVWEPSDYDSIQKKIDSKNWSDSEDDHSMSSQKAAFWKGMKKKLRV
ncbi:hypothetical protein MAM1_0037d02718 [Mucor ambiguus]|uniref:Uncharacterized protein n=1 Tax=Mucor ambiguus TaxID=91626 RepID=A0A0C9M346_9FUNG|nr:hypothetical protein MAM1_0037d02718 [Mucor ambiguus]